MNIDPDIEVHDLVKLDMLGRVGFMFNALISTSNKNVTIQEARERLVQALAGHCMKHKEDGPLWTTNRQVLEFLSETKERRTCYDDSLYIRKIFEENKDPELTLDARVAKAQTAWVDLLRVRAEALGFSDHVTSARKVIPEQGSQFRCFHCGKKAQKRCGICLKIHYCSKECQTIDWKIKRHRGLCTAKTDAAAPSSSSSSSSPQVGENKKKTKEKSKKAHQSQKRAEKKQPSQSNDSMIRFKTKLNQESIKQDVSVIPAVETPVSVPMAVAVAAADAES